MLSGNKRKLAKTAKIFHTFLAFRLVSLLQIKENRNLKFALPMVYYVDDV
jgi:hypothetical protein